MSKWDIKHLSDGEWFTVGNRKNHRDICCHCGLEHKVEFKIKKRKIMFRSWRIGTKKKK